MTPDQLAAIITNPRETPSLEFKSPGSRANRDLLLKVIKGMIAMANHRDGGVIVIGIGDDKTKGAVRKHLPIGVSPQDAATWDRDHLSDEIAKYCDPPLEFSADTQEIDEKIYVVIEKEEYRDTPVITARDGQQNGRHVLKDGALYVRSAHKPESVILSTSSQMRSLIDIALAKHMQRHLSISARIGGVFETSTSDQDQYEKESDQDPPRVSETLVHIRERCYWHITISPEQYEKNRLRFTALQEIVRQSSVAIRGWSFPHVEYDRAADIRDSHWWGQVESSGVIHEVWRLFRSGQFEFTGGLWEDWAQPGEFVDAQPGKMPFWGAIHRFLEVYKFASRLAATDAGGPRMLVQVEVLNINGRQLYNDNPRQIGLRPYSGPDSFRFPSTPNSYIRREDLIADPESLAAEATSDFLDAFGFDVSAEGVKIWQSEVLKHR